MNIHVASCNIYKRKIDDKRHIKKLCFRNSIKLCVVDNKLPKSCLADHKKVDIEDCPVDEDDLTLATRDKLHVSDFKSALGMSF